MIEFRRCKRVDQNQQNWGKIESRPSDTAIIQIINLQKATMKTVITDEKLFNK